jgi:hypothetical protein
LHAQQEHTTTFCNRVLAKHVQLATFALALFPITMMWPITVPWGTTARTEHNRPFNSPVLLEHSTTKPDEKQFMTVSHPHQDTMHQELETLFQLGNVLLDIIAPCLQQRVRHNVPIHFARQAASALLVNNVPVVQVRHCNARLDIIAVTTVVW